MFVLFSPSQPQSAPDTIVNSLGWLAGMFVRWRNMISVVLVNMAGWWGGGVRTRDKCGAPGQYGKSFRERERERERDDTGDGGDLDCYPSYLE